jgi:hypothetical protein
MKARISFLRERDGAVFTSRMIEVSSYLDKLKYQLRRLSPQRRIGARCHAGIRRPSVTSCDVHHSASRARIIAGLSGFLTLIQSRDGPDR